MPFGRNLLINGTVRATRANTYGLLGFGREVINPLDGQLLDSDNGYELEYELSAAMFLTPTIVAGVEYRTQSNRLANKTFALTAAWVDLGNLPFQPDSRAAYLSLQASF